MSRPQLRHQFMVFDAAVDSHSTLPLTLDEALDDLSQEDRQFFSPGYTLRPRQPEKSLYLPAAPPSTRKSSFEFSDYTSHEKPRVDSFSSDGSAPGMVEDHSGFSDSDTDPSAKHDPYEESMGRLWDTYEDLLLENKPSDPIIFQQAYLPGCLDDFQSPLPPFSSEATLPHEASPTQSLVKSRPSRDSQKAPRSLIPVATRSQSLIKASPRCCKESPENHIINLGDSTPKNQAPGLHRSLAQQTARHGPNTAKSLPIIPQKRAVGSLPPSSSPSKRSRPPPEFPRIDPVIPKKHPVYRDLPCYAAPVTKTPYNNSSHAYVLQNTTTTTNNNNLPPQPAPFPTLVPVPLVAEKSVFEYGTDSDSDSNNDGNDNENANRRRSDPFSQLSRSIASKMHLRGLSLGSRLGGFVSGRKEAGASGGSNYEVVGRGQGRRRSATELFRGVFWGRGMK